MQVSADPQNSHPILVIAGPTASGKSALALRIAEVLGGVIINADSMQIYRDLPVLTARPGTAEETRAPHRLYGVIDAAERCSVGHWRRLALDEIVAARTVGRIPIVVGGSGLYLAALMRGLAEIPAVPAAVQEAAQTLHARLGGAAFQAMLAARDPGGSARLAAGDTQRLIRAYAVIEATGRSLADWQRQTPSSGMATVSVTLLPPRDALYAACDTRFGAMVERGAVEEVRILLDRHLDPSLPAMKAVGVRELAAWFDGKLSLEAAVAAAQQATRHYAKRQFTWLRHQMGAGASIGGMIVDEQFSERLWPNIFAFIRQFRLTHGF